MDLLLDFQGFKDNCNHFIIKELSIVSKDGKYIQHWIVKSPFPYSVLDYQRKKCCYWNTKYYHGISWDAGDITCQDLHHVLTDILKDCCVFVKGKEKAEYIQEHFTNCYVFELEDFPSMKSLRDPGQYCFHHRQYNFTCALNNVLRLLKFYNEEIN